MGNCLVTKLKETVSNNKLPKIGELAFIDVYPNNATSADNHVIGWETNSSGITAKARFIDGIFSSSAWNPSTPPAGVTEVNAWTEGGYLYPNGGYTAKMTWFIEKANLARLDMGLEAPDFSIQELSHCPLLESLTLSAVVPFTVAELAECVPNIKTFKLLFRSNVISGNVSDFPTTLQNILIPESGNRLVGSCDHFLDFTNLVKLNLAYCSNANFTCKRSTYDTLLQRLGNGNFVWTGPIIEDE